ncbi:MAG: hypothetical protein EOM24_16530 [Chloroflexia bacterium]|nr:hypothetical protein [Chloroflexia bacterium]
MSQTDAQLRAIAPVMRVTVGAGQCERWHATLHPPPDHWWWSLVSGRYEGRNSFWSLLIGTVLVLALSLALDIAIRLQVFGAGADFFTIFIGLAQVLLALLVGSALTGAGVRVTATILDRLRITRYRHLATLGLACVPLVVITACWLALPNVARWYYQRGFAALQEGHLTRARHLLERSVSLDPDVAPAFYTLGVVHEDALAFEAALHAYGTALQLDPGLYPAYNNMARLYVRRLHDGASALELLSQALALQPPDVVRPTLLKNRGWARLELELFTLAEADLREALALDAAAAEAHCLLARTLEHGSSTAADTALRHWHLCLATASHQVVAAELLDQARERVAQRRE